MASRRVRLSVSPSRLEKTPSTELDLAPLTERTHRDDRPARGDRTKATALVRKDRRHRNPVSSTQSRQPSITPETSVATKAPSQTLAPLPTLDISTTPTEDASTGLRVERNQARTTRRRRARLESELEAAETRFRSGMLSVPAHSLQELIMPLGPSTPTLNWSLLPLEAASSHYHLLPVQVNDSHGTCVALWLPDAPLNIVPSFMVRMDHPPDETQLENWSLDEKTSVLVGGDIEVFLRFGHACGNTLAKESPSLQVPILGAPATTMLGILLCPVRQRISNAHGDFITSIRCLRK